MILNGSPLQSYKLLHLAADKKLLKKYYTIKYSHVLACLCNFITSVLPLN